MSSIADLRGLWLDSHNRYAKAFRIISKEYMRKHNLGHIFRSKVQYLYKHLKYSNKINYSLEDPINFTNMKDY